jgi:prepilin-type N-terminal cleavage/methylation domain-containing protein/prepilin-type processing-associated H-X9-DG protein
MCRRKGFTLIELLVVIAIIGILASMVFPVFARARESARKAVCLSNVKNIALAIQMYLADNNDTMFPGEHRQEVFEYFDAASGGGEGGGTGGEECELMYTGHFEHANPDLRWAVILDEYVNNRDVWRCPSARVELGAFFILPHQDWLGYLQDTEGQWGYNADVGPCAGTWPSGWGGAVTDSIVQGIYATDRAEGAAIAHKAFVQNIAINGPSWAREGAQELKLAEVEDVVKYVVIADGGTQIDTLPVGSVAYPERCNVACPCYGADWDNCTWSQSCGIPLDIKFNREEMKQWTRHLGGSNLGFLDGHAAWWSAGQILAEAPQYSCGCFGGGIVDRDLHGLHPMGPTTAAGTGAIPGDYCFPEMGVLY